MMMASPSIKNGGQIYWDWADGKAGMIDVRDVAESAFGALTGKAEIGKEYILTGPKSISMHDVAASFTEVLDKEINYVAVPHEASKESMMGMGFPEFIVDGYVELSQGFAKGFAILPQETLKHLQAMHPGPSMTLQKTLKVILEVKIN